MFVTSDPSFLAAMLPQFEIVHLFWAPQGYLVEIKRLDLPETAPKSKRYQWLWIEAGTVSTLGFVGMSEHPERRRTFEEAQLRFDDVRGELSWSDGRSAALKALPAEALPQALQWRVHEHLN